MLTVNTIASIIAVGLIIYLPSRFLYRAYVNRRNIKRLHTMTPVDMITEAVFNEKIEDEDRDYLVRLAIKKLKDDKKR